MLRAIHDWWGNRRYPATHAMLAVIESQIAEFPDEWTRETYWLHNHGRKIALWISNGRSVLNLRCYTNDHGYPIYAPEIGIPLLWKWRLWRSVKGKPTDESTAIARTVVARFERQTATVISFNNFKGR